MTDVKKLTVKRIFSDPILFLAFGFGSGLAKKAPGTFGTLAAIPIYWLLSQTNIVIYSFSTVIICCSGIWICGKAAAKLGVHDHPGIVWDEIAGLLVTLWWSKFSWAVLVAGFLLFRLFDILKPWPIKRVDQEVRGGLGIMLDDILAGLLAALFLFMGTLL
jgi:phosphatidylglycerophosphatase A